MTHFTINYRKVSPFTINKSNVCILRLVIVKTSLQKLKNTPGINKQLFYATKMTSSPMVEQCFDTMIAVSSDKEWL